MDCSTNGCRVQSASSCVARFLFHDSKPGIINLLVKGKCKLLSRWFDWTLLGNVFKINKKHSLAYSDNLTTHVTSSRWILDQMHQRSKHSFFPISETFWFKIRKYSSNKKGAWEEEEFCKLERFRCTPGTVLWVRLS